MGWMKAAKVVDVCNVNSIICGSGGGQSINPDQKELPIMRQPKISGKGGRRWFRILRKQESKTPTGLTDEASSSHGENVQDEKPKTATQCEVKVDVVQNPKKTVRFSTTETRRHQLILGDNPYSTIPLGIGWTYAQGGPQAVPPLEDSDSQDVIHREPQNPEHVCANEYEPLTLEERRARLLGVGYTEQQIQVEECRRKVQIAMEWAYRHDHPDTDIPCTIPNAAMVIRKYIV